MFQSVLIANRGEIAVRIIRSCRELGIRSIAVYSEADRGAPHVLLADDAILIGEAPASRSYLDPSRILAAADQAGAEAIHPGYGFLAENAEFARAVLESGRVWIGPSPESIAQMGDKVVARGRMMEIGVPVVPGGGAGTTDPDEGWKEAERVGFPLLIKAGAGGGGKGMRPVFEAERFRDSFQAAVREAAAAFGDGRVYLERYLPSPRHIEVQLLADRGGKVLHLGERECSLQRRHQKVVEETPSPAVSPELRAALGEAAVRAAESVGYEGAGTVEFLVQDGTFHFLEMNTRIQVEHPITEAVTGIDLVEWQLRIARGEELPWAQEDIRFSGHSIECRITAENPEGGFLPVTGRVTALTLPGGPGVRWDGGIAPGSEIGLHYDSLLGKLIVHAPDRTAAIRRMERALLEFRLEGVDHTAAFLLRVMRDPDFREGTLDVGFIERKPELRKAELSEDDSALLAAAAALLEKEWGRQPQGVSGKGGNEPLDDRSPRGRPLPSWRESPGHGRWGR